MDQITKGIIIGAGGILLAGGVALFLSKGTQIWSHVDKNVPIFELQDIDKKLDEAQKNLKEQYRTDHKAIDDAVKELKKTRKNILTTPVKGRATRQIKVKRQQHKNVIWVNSYSDARIFKRDQKVVITSPNAAIEATVGGTINNTDQTIIFKANAKVAEEIGLSEQLGVLDGVTIKRILPGDDGL